MTMTYAPVQHTPITSRIPVLKVIGLGGGGCNAINRMVELGLSGIEFIGANTDHQALESCKAPVKVQLGPKATRGLGSGGTPSIGEAAAEESAREIARALEGADMVFLTAGMGGGTGTGSIPVAAKIARALGAVTVSIVTTPFSFEMGKRQKNANEGMAKLRPFSDTLITVPNDKLLYVAPRDLPMEVAFRLADDVLRQGIQGIAELITTPGMINIDFAHVRNVMRMGGGSLLSMGVGEGDGKARKAIDQALHHPLLESANLYSAGGIIANFTGGPDLTFLEVTDALTYLQEMTGNQAEIIPGFITDERLSERAQVILVVTGLGGTAIDQQLFQTKQSASFSNDPIENAVRVAEQPIVPVTTPEVKEAYMKIDFAQPEEQIYGKTEPQVYSKPQQSALPANLDLPAFLRRRARTNQQGF
jgi:cell division protein FtsZ